MHDGHVGGPKQYKDFSLGNIFYFYANIFRCFSPPAWPPCTHSIQSESITRAVLDTKRRFSISQTCFGRNVCLLHVGDLKIFVLYLKLVVGFLLSRPFDNAWSLLRAHGCTKKQTNKQTNKQTKFINYKK